MGGRVSEYERVYLNLCESYIKLVRVYLQLYGLQLLIILANFEYLFLPIATI